MIREQGVRPDGTDGYGKNEPLRGTQVETNNGVASRSDPIVCTIELGAETKLSQS